MTDTIERKRIGSEKWACPKCGWRSNMPSKNRALLHVTSNCKYKPIGRHNCLTHYLNIKKKGTDNIKKNGAL